MSFGKKQAELKQWLGGILEAIFVVPHFSIH